jgi:LCP family protein required for cell wall assembly
LKPEAAASFSPDTLFTPGPLPLLQKPINVLILGTKAVPGDASLEGRFGDLTDTILLVHVDPQERRMEVLSIPRDTRTQLPGHGVDKLNAANVYGGASLAAASTRYLLQAPVDRYLRVNLGGVQQLVEALGGVTIDVPKAMRYRDTSQHFSIDLKPGRQHLNGEQALQFLRFRHDVLGDIGRVERQQHLMTAIVQESINPLTLLRLPQLLFVARENLDSNLRGSELLAISGLAVTLGSDRIHFHTLPGRFGGPEYSVSYWIPDYESIDRLMAEKFK